MATNTTHYPSFSDALLLHIRLMKKVGEKRFGVFDRNLIESALARSQPAAFYENADLIRQAATLCYGLIKNHPWVGGNKRTATAITSSFLLVNGIRLTAARAAVVKLVLEVEADGWQIDEIEAWLREHTAPLTT